MKNKFSSKFSTLIGSPLPFYRVLFLLFGRFFLTLIYSLGLVFDNLFFRRYKRTEITNPVFLIGHPRSGTTFLHRFLLNLNPNYRGMLLWEMVVPYSFLRKIFNPIFKLISKVSNRQLYDSKIHTTGLFKAETDDAALFFKKFGGLFFWLYFGAFKNYTNDYFLEKELLNASSINETLSNLQILHSKNLAESKSISKTAFSKSFSLVLDIKKILDYYPKAKIILLLRDPLEAIPSSMSLARNILEKLYNFNKFDEEIKMNYFKNLYVASKIFYKALYDILQSPNVNKKVFLIEYKNLKNNFKDEIMHLLNYLELNSCENNIGEKIAEQEKNQSSYRSMHIYSLDEFGLNANKIKDDFDFIYKNYDF
jgi:omega-hydroxy-beta-dihydromenaquinone-9 sulfotransferase